MKALNIFFTIIFIIISIIFTCFLNHQNLNKYLYNDSSKVYDFSQTQYLIKENFYCNNIKYSVGELINKNDLKNNCNFEK